MSRGKQSRKVWVGALVTAVGLVGSAEAVVYSFEDFEGGTVNYDIVPNVDGGTLTYRQDGGNNITADIALTNTDYVNGSPSRSGVWANNNLPLTVAGEPTGQHGFVCNSKNRTLTTADPLTLVSDSVGTVDINFKTMVYGNGQVFSHTATVFYSALGDFSDQVMIASYSTADWVDPAIASAANALPASILGDTQVVEDEWTTLSFSISSTDVTFTDTAKIRFNKWAPNVEQQMIFYDDISITGVVVPEPSTFALFGLAGFALLLRRRK